MKPALLIATILFSSPLFAKTNVITYKAKSSTVSFVVAFYAAVESVTQVAPYREDFNLIPTEAVRQVIPSMGVDTFVDVKSQNTLKKFYAKTLLVEAEKNISGSCESLGGSAVSNPKFELIYKLEDRRSSAQLPNEYTQKGQIFVEASIDCSIN